MGKKITVIHPSMNENEWMNLEFYIRMFKDGKWQSVNIQDLSEEEFRQFLLWKLRFAGLKKEG